MLFCRNHQMEGHDTSECRGVGISKKKQRPPKKKWMGNKKGKEKAHNTIDGGRGDSDSDNEDSHHVKFEQCLTTSMVNFSDYSLCDGNSLTSPNNPKARAYSARTAASLPTIIIDSGTTSHIHSNRRDFTSLNSSSSGSINRFGEGSRSIEGCSKAQLPAQLPTGGCSNLKSQSMCFVPHSTPTLLSVLCFDKADMYTLFGDRWCVIFKKLDNSKLFHHVLTKEKVILTGTKGTKQLYHLNPPHQSKKTSYHSTQSPMSKLKQLHC